MSWGIYGILLFKPCTDIRSRICVRRGTRLLVGGPRSPLSPAGLCHFRSWRHSLDLRCWSLFLVIGAPQNSGSPSLWCCDSDGTICYDQGKCISCNATTFGSYLEESFALCCRAAYRCLDGPVRSTATWIPQQCSV